MRDGRKQERERRGKDWGLLRRGELGIVLRAGGRDALNAYHFFFSYGKPCLRLEPCTPDQLGPTYFSSALSGTVTVVLGGETSKPPLEFRCPSLHCGQLMEMHSIRTFYLKNLITDVIYGTDLRAMLFSQKD
jgi:hypothetical protein